MTIGHRPNKLICPVGLQTCHYFRSINYIEGANILHEDLMILKHLEKNEGNHRNCLCRALCALWLPNYGFPWRHTGLKGDQKSQQTQQQGNC